MNNLKVFQNEEFGQVRTVVIDAKTYFVANDVAKALGYKRPADAVTAHCKGSVKHRYLTDGGEQEIKIIPEGDLYRLIIKSKLPSAEKFESWIMEEVLPSLRKTGTYSLTPLSTKDQIRLALKAYDELDERVDVIDERLHKIESRMDVIGSFDNEWMLKSIQDTIKAKVYLLTKGEAEYQILWSHYFYSAINSMLHRKYGVATIKSIPAEKYSEARSIILEWEPSDYYIKSRLDKMVKDKDKNLLPDKKVIALLQYMKSTGDGSKNPFTTT